MSGFALNDRGDIEQFMKPQYPAILIRACAIKASSDGSCGVERRQSPLQIDRKSAQVLGNPLGPDSATSLDILSSSSTGAACRSSSGGAARRRYFVTLAGVLLETFACALAHDFKQPILQIITFSQMISDASK